MPLGLEKYLASKVSHLFFAGSLIEIIYVPVVILIGNLIQNVYNSKFSNEYHISMYQLLEAEFFLTFLVN